MPVAGRDSVRLCHLAHRVTASVGSTSASYLCSPDYARLISLSVRPSDFVPLAILISNAVESVGQMAVKN